MGVSHPAAPAPWGWPEREFTGGISPSSASGEPHVQRGPSACTQPESKPPAQLPPGTTHGLVPRGGGSSCASGRRPDPHSPLPPTLSDRPTPAGRGARLRGSLSSAPWDDECSESGPHVPVGHPGCSFQDVPKQRAGMGSHV